MNFFKLFLYCSKIFWLDIKSNIRAAVKQLDKGASGIVVVVENNKTFKGLITDGDMRRGLLNGFRRFLVRF